MSSDLKMSLGSKIRAARKRNGITQDELAARINRTPESISNIERGLQLPSIETLSELGKVLGVPVAEFFEELDLDKIPRSARRIELEHRLRDIARQLSDRDLAIAVAQANILLVGQP